MSELSEISNIDLSVAYLQQAAKRCISQSLLKQKENCVRRLEVISIKSSNDVVANKAAHTIPKVFRKFKSYYQGGPLPFPRNELRTLSFSFSYSEANENLSAIISSESETKAALELLSSFWRDSFLIGLFDCYLNNWEIKHGKPIVLLEGFIRKKLENYFGDRKILTAFKSNLRYFDSKNGDLVLGTELALKNLAINDAAKYLSLPESCFSYSYFSKVILTYYEKRKQELSNLIDDFEKVLNAHGSIVTSKRLLSKIIIHVHNNELISIQEKVKTLAFNFIGDPENKIWIEYQSSTDEEINELKRAKAILNEWLTRQFIEVFFNLCIYDERRKRFWLKYVPHISSFKVYGPAATKNRLKVVERISRYLDTRFETLPSNRDVSAFILYIGGYMIVEFSKDGYACCAYKINSPNSPKLNQKFHNVDYLRNSSLPLAKQSSTDFYFNNEEGRLFHTGDWEYKFSSWLKSRVF